MAIKIKQYVYFIQHSIDGPIKIGVSSNPLSRRDEMQTGNPFPLRILLLIPGGYDLEWELHQKFSRHRISGDLPRKAGGTRKKDRLISRDSREWFWPDPEIISYVAELLRK
jgi:hypothetical protein